MYAKYIVSGFADIDKIHVIDMRAASFRHFLLSVDADFCM